MNSPDPSADRTELLLRTSRRAFMIVLTMLLIASATLIAHAIRPGSLLADWPSKAPWMIPIAIVLATAAAYVPGARRSGEESPELRALMSDEFRQANLVRAQRVALVTVLVAQLPLAIAVSPFGTIAAVTVMGVATVTLGVATTIVAFLMFDRE